MSNKIIVKDHKYYFKIRGLGGVKGDKGDTGPAGPRGPQGPYVDVVAGTTTTLPAGSSAQVTVNNTGNTSVLNFGIPQGTKGDKGDAGTPGAQGPRGFAATVNVGQTTTGAPGTNASVINAGNEHDAVLKFTIPQGAKGDTGETGPQGPTGGIKSTVVAELPETGESDKYYLVNRTAEGGTVTTTDGYAQITNDENAGDLTLNELDGNATQKTYTGKNLMPILNIERTINNVKFTPQADGSVLVNGTNNTANYAVYVLTFNTAENNVYRTIPAEAGTYCVSNEGTIPSGVYVQCFTQITGQSVSQKNADGVFTVAQNFNFGCAIRVDAGTTVNNLIIKPMVEKTTTKTSWEPYVGGVPSPNPDYPQTVNVVSGRQLVQVCGKNLLDASAAIANYRLDSVGAPYGEAGFTTSDFVKVNPSTQYNLSLAELDSSFFTSLCQYDKNKNFIGERIYIARTVRSYNFTTLSEAEYVRVSSKSTVFGSSLILSQGNQSATYEPYQAQSQVINLGGSNLFDMANAAENTVLKWADAGDNAENKSITSDYIEAREGQSFSSNYMMVVFCYDTSKTYLGTIQNNDTTISKMATDAKQTKTIPSGYGVGYIRVVYRTGSNGNLDMTQQDIMLNKGSTALPYVPYTTYAYELAKIGTYQDYIWNDDGTWKIHEAIHKVVLDGYTETEWSIRNTGTARYYYRLRYLSDVHYMADGSEWISDRVSLGIVGETTTDEGCFIVNGGELRIRYGTEMSLTDWKDYLKDHNITLYYQAETPTDTEITDSELIEQLNHIYSLYQGQNNLWLIPSAGAQGEMEVKYRLNYEQETDIVPKTPVVLTLTDGGVINPCGCRENIQLIMRETEGN